MSNQHGWVFIIYVNLLILPVSHIQMTVLNMVLYSNCGFSSKILLNNDQCYLGLVGASNKVDSTLFVVTEWSLNKENQYCKYRISVHRHQNTGKYQHTSIFNFLKKPD